MPCGRRRVIHIKNNKLLTFVDQCAKFVDADTVHLKLTDKRPPPPRGRGPPLTLALGKERKAYLLDRNNLGGIGGQLAMETVSDRAIIPAPTTYPAAVGIFV